jgi:multiple antibiotic resistance protein
MVSLSLLQVFKKDKNTMVAILSLALTLFFIMDPLGNLKSFIHYLEGLHPKRQKQIIIREMLIALVTMIAFDFLGDYFFSLLEISRITAYLCSGLILFLVAIKILFPKSETDDDKPRGEPFLVPLAIPMIAGPAVLATIMLYAVTEAEPWVTLVAICIAWVASCVILLLARPLLKLVGAAGLTVFERLMGMVLVLMAVQRILQGIMLLYTKLQPM